jgi:serine/threonine protein kinase
MRDSSVTLEVLTPAYAPPEMFRHEAPSGAVDVYALCATLYAVMRGHPPRWETDRSPSLITLMDLFNRPIPDLPHVPKSMTEVLRYGMANDPRARPTAEQLREMLTGLHLAPGGPTPPPPSVYRSASYPTPRPVPPVHQTRSDETPTVNTEQRKKRKWFLGGFGVVLLLTASLSGAWLASAQRAGVRSVASKLRVPVASTSPMGWRVFATGTLPPDVDPLDRAAVTADETVRRVCSVRSFRRVAQVQDLSGWSFSVQPSAGKDRGFRCLAARAE